MRHLGALSAMSMLIACGDPLAEIPRLSEADIPEDAAELGVVPPPENEADRQGGFLAQLLGGAADAPQVPDAPADDAAGADQSQDLPPEAYGVSSDLSPDAPDSPGLFGLFAGKPDPEAAETVALTPLDGHTGRLPYGRIAQVCDLPKRAMGRKVAQYPETRPRHVVYDSDPASTAPRSFYLTGFDDGCARQFTASVALFGSVGMHEQLRYGLPAQVQPYSDTDKAYERIKSRVCSVPRKKPCGGRIGRLENDTVFVTIYENFGGNQQWFNLLLHDGRVIAQDIKG